MGGSGCGYKMATQEVFVMALLCILTMVDTRSCACDEKCVEIKYTHTNEFKYN